MKNNKNKSLLRGNKFPAQEKAVPEDIQSTCEAVFID